MDYKIRCVVTGLGLICALGDGTDKCWSAAINGVTGIHDVKTFSTEGCYALFLLAHAVTFLSYV